MNKQSRFEIAKEDLLIVQSIILQLIPHLEVWAFDSRVTGKARKFSDLDLAIFTKEPLHLDTYLALKKTFSDSNLPFKIDMVDWSEIDENFKNIIKQNHIQIYKPRNNTPHYDPH